MTPVADPFANQNGSDEEMDLNEEEAVEEEEEEEEQQELEDLPPEFVIDSNEALRFQLVRNEADIVEPGAEEKILEGQPPKTFKPEMTHQIYGDQETIFGYKDLKVDLLMTCGTLKAYIAMKSGETFKPEAIEGSSKTTRSGPDEVIPPLAWLLAPDQLVKSMDEFRAVVREEEPKFKPMGEKVHEWTIEKENAQRHFEVYFCDCKVPNFVDYHARLQPWIMFYIDAASYIDSDDENWRYFLLFERFQTDGTPRYGIVGYITVYQYYAYPSNMRPRISQMLILPPFRKIGLGSRLLETVQRYYWKNNNVVDITVEDPSDDFVRLRDYIDSKNCMKLDAFSEENLKKGYSEEMAKAANEAYKICKKQSRRVYEILRFKCTKRNDPEDYKSYRVAVKQRLNWPYLKEDRQLEKLKKVLSWEEFNAATLNMTDKAQRLENLKKQYDELEGHYINIVERINAS